MSLMIWLDRYALGQLFVLTGLSLLSLTACTSCTSSPSTPSSSTPTTPTPSPPGALILPVVSPASPLASPQPLVSPAAPSPAPAAKPEYYIVQEGDTRFGIAERFGTTVEALLQANRLTDPNQIESGRRLVIPR